eukprot:3067996-Karenia_brevis.AAC.1
MSKTGPVRCPKCVQMHSEGRLDASSIRLAQNGKKFRGFCQAHAPPAARKSLGLAPVAKRACGANSVAKVLVRRSVRR